MAGSNAGSRSPPTKANATTTVAVASSRLAARLFEISLVIAYWLLTRPDLYQDLGSTYFDDRDRTRVERRLVHRLEGLGYTVELKPRAT